MAQVRPETFQLPLRALWILLPPIMLTGASIGLIAWAGYPLDHLARAVVQNGHAEAAGRLRMLATWLLLAAASIATIAYCLRSARNLAPKTFRLLLSAYAGLVAAGVLLVAVGGVQGGQGLVDRRVVCAALELAQSERPAPGGGAFMTYGRPDVAADGQFACGRGNLKYRQMWWLNEIQKYLLVLFIPALALGIISCRALPGSPTEEDCRYQVRRLNLHLYLTAAALVAGLVFRSAMLHWPGFAFTGTAASSYRAHVDAYILYGGVAYSLFIAAFYVPVAAALARACTPKQPRPGATLTPDPGAEGPVAELLGTLKTLLALFAPAIAGLLGGVLNL